MSSIGFEKPQVKVASVPARTWAAGSARILGRELLSSDWLTVVSLAAAACLFHFAINLLATGRYGFFRDELYYASCGDHLAWGYVDHAPLVAVVARLSRLLFGDSLVALRFFPAVAAGAKILLTGWMVHELGGRRFAQTLAATAVFIAPVYLTFDGFLSMNAFEPLFWMLCAAIAIHIVNGETPRGWILFGLVAGVGLLNKHSMLFFGSGVFVGLWVTAQRKYFRSKWIWLGGLLSFVIFLPNLVWEIQHDWPTIEILRNVARVKNAPVTPLEFIWQQSLLVHPLGTPICLAGLYFFLLAKEGRTYRFLGWAYLVTLVELLVLKGKIYYLASAYPMLFAAGALWIEKFIRERNWSWLKPAVLLPLGIGGLVAAPLALPLLPVEATARYARFWNVEAVKVENPESGKLPQFFADMFGWENQAATVARVYHGLSPAEQAKCAILAYNFGEAGAIDFFGRAYGLPRAISGNNNYYLWGPRGYSGELVISVGVPLPVLNSLFEQVERAAVIFDEYAVPDESNLPVYICRKPKMSFEQAWPRLKDYS